MSAIDDIHEELDAIALAFRLEKDLQRRKKLREKLLQDAHNAYHSPQMRIHRLWCRVWGKDVLSYEKAMAMARLVIDKSLGG